MYLLCLQNGTVIPARKCVVENGRVVAWANNGAECRIPLAEIKQAWEVAPNSALPLEELRQHTNLAGALFQLENILEIYQKIEPNDPLVTGQQSAVIFGSAALTLGLVPERTSEDVDIALSPEFLEWAKTHWPDEGYLQMDLTDPLIFTHCGNWRSRTSFLQGARYRFQILHPFDVVLQKLLRRDAQRFEQKDIPDIIAIMEKLQPTESTLRQLLTENYTRYVPDPRDHLEPKAYDSVLANTEWLISRYLSGQTVDAIINQAYERQNQSLYAAHLLEPKIERTTVKLYDVLPVKPINFN